MQKNNIYLGSNQDLPLTSNHCMQAPMNGRPSENR